MNKSLTTLRMVLFDLQFQFRHGFYYAYGFVCTVYLLILFSLPQEVQSIAAALLIVTDTSLLGFIFIGGIILLERDQRVTESLLLTPLKVEHYFFAKGISLTLLALLTSCLLYIPFGGISIHLFPALAAIVSVSLGFIFLGIGIASTTTSLNGYFGYMLLIGLLASGPAFFHFVGSVSFLKYLSPIFPAVVLMTNGIYRWNIIDIAVSCGVLILWAAGTFLWGTRIYKKNTYTYGESI